MTQFVGIFSDARDCVFCALWRSAEFATLHADDSPDIVSDTGAHISNDSLLLSNHGIGNKRIDTFLNIIEYKGRIHLSQMY